MDLTLDSKAVTVHAEQGESQTILTDGNRSSDWMPRPFFETSATVSEKPSEEEAWASLAARARADWAVENPF